MTLSRFGAALAAAALVAQSLPAQAHVTFAGTQAVQNAAFTAELRVPHGCQGQPTVKLRVRIPEGVVASPPEPKEGWSVETVKNVYARAYHVRGETVAEGITEIIWSGSLEDGKAETFVFPAAVTDAYAPGAQVYFPVVQQCATESIEWSEIPAAGQDPHSLKSPAPGVTVVAENAGAKAPLLIEQAWSRATPAGAQVGGGYVRITNTGTASDRLIGGSLPVASRIEVHEMRSEGEVMRMQPVAGGLEIKPGATIELKPGGQHLMFMGLKEPLKPRHVLKGTLLFEKAGPVEVEFTVQPMGATMDHKH